MKAGVVRTLCCRFAVLWLLLCALAQARTVSPVFAPDTRPEFSFAVPASWEVVSHDDGQVSFVAPGTLEYGGQLAKVSSSGSQAEAVALARETLTQNVLQIAASTGVTEAQAGELVESTDNGIVFLGIRADGKRAADGADAALALQFFITPSGNAYMFVLVGSPAAHDRHLAALEAILDSVRLVADAAAEPQPAE